jgi:two-component system cell cycle sensor histidine kinase/response regulator CckA
MSLQPDQKNPPADFFKDPSLSIPLCFTLGQDHKIVLPDAFRIQNSICIMKYEMNDLLFFLLGGICTFLIIYILRNRLSWLRKAEHLDLKGTDPEEIAFLLNSLKAKGELQDKLLDHLPVGVLLLNSDFEILSANQLGTSTLQILQPDFDGGRVTHLADKPVHEFVQQVADIMPLELDIGSGPPHVFEVQLKGVLTREGKYWILMAADVTDKKLVQKQVQFQERMAAIGKFSSGIAHDFNNILSAILIYLDLILKDSSLSPSNRPRVEAVKEQSQRASGLIQSILDFGRDGPQEFIVFDFVPFLVETRDLLERILPENIQIKLDLPERIGSLAVQGDPVRLQLVLMNLAQNSWDAMPGGGRFEIILERVDIYSVQEAPHPEMDPGEWISVQVKDNGIGIDPDYQARIFEPFFTTKESKRGTGLGLSQAYGIIRGHGGYIDLKSDPGIGTTFRIYLPISDREITPLAENLPGILMDAKGSKILVVEDDAGIQEALRETLEDIGFQVIQAVEGESGLRILKEIGMDLSLVICDVLLPKFGGTELYYQTRAICPSLDFIFITGHPEAVIKEEIDQDPHTYLLFKPFQVNDLLKIIQSSGN